jgi:hypothetical protein
LSGFFDRCKDWHVKNLFASLLGVHTRDETVFAVSVFDALFSVELTGFAGDTLGNDLGVFIDVD